MLRELAQEIAEKSIARNELTIANGPYSIVITRDDDGSVSNRTSRAVKRLQRMIERLHGKYPPVAKRLAFHVTKDSIDDPIGDSRHVGGVTYLPSENAESGAVTFREDLIASQAPIRFSPGWRSGYLQTSDESMELGEWIVAHEWGHTTDRRLFKPEPSELFEKWSSMPDGYGLGKYGRYSAAEAYAECFADWVTSEGKTTNPATLAYAEFYDWEIP